jgi:hypothetical protein
VYNLRPGLRRSPSDYRRSVSPTTHTLHQRLPTRPRSCGQRRPRHPQRPAVQDSTIPTPQRQRRSPFAVPESLRGVPRPDQHGLDLDPVLALIDHALPARAPGSGGRPTDRLTCPLRTTFHVTKVTTCIRRSEPPKAGSSIETAERLFPMFARTTPTGVHTSGSGAPTPCPQPGARHPLGDVAAGASSSLRCGRRAGRDGAHG